MRKPVTYFYLIVVSLLLGSTSLVSAQPAPPPEATQSTQATGKTTAQTIEPFGANLFKGSYQGQHQDGRNSNYRIMPGDRVAVNTWGALEVKQVFVVDGQGNIFLPSIGPIPLAGVKNRRLTAVVKAQIARVYRTGVGVYTNLLTAAPVGVYVTGGVPRPGRYAGVPADSILFFLNQAGGIEAESGSYRRISILRENEPIAQVDLYDFILKGSMPLVQFADGDVVLVHRRGATIEVQGQVTSPARIELQTEKSTGADVMEIVAKAARATTVTVQGVFQGKSYNKSTDATRFTTMVLHDGDSVFLHVENRPQSITVNIEGEFKGPSVITVVRGSRLLDVLNFVEVDPALTNVNAVHLRRPSVADSQKRTIEQSLHRLERSAMLALSATDKEAAIRVREAELLQAFVKTARTIQPLGRIVTASLGQQQNLLLMDGDTIVIPAVTNIVKIGGEVRLTQAVVYTPGMSAGDYVGRAGGFTARADDDNIIILHASAEVTRGDEDTSVHPGDEILVAPKVDSKLFQNVSDLTQVLYQVAVAAAVIIAL